MRLNTYCQMDMLKWKILKFQNLHVQVIYIYIFLINLFHYSNFVHYTLFQSTFIYIGIEDKLVSTSGYGIVVTDEASSFFQDIKGQDN